MRGATRFLGLWALVFVACSSTGVGNPYTLDETEQALVDAGDEGTRAGDTASTLVTVPLLALTDAASLATADAASGTAQLRTPMWFEPSGCLVTTREGAAVTFDFQGCRTGALGLSAIRGQLIASYAVREPGSVELDVTTPAPLTIGAAQVTLSARVSLAITGATRSIVWSGGYHATRAIRPDIDHTASYQIVYDTSSQCLELGGSATTTMVGKAGVESVLGGYIRCGARTACPQKGTLTLTRLPDRDRSITVEYLGGAFARVRAPERNGDTQVSLVCDG